MPLVEPPMASSTRIALSNAAASGCGRGEPRRAPCCTACAPVSLGHADAVGVTAGGAGAARHRHAQRLGDTQAMVLAVPITEQVPTLGTRLVVDLVDLRPRRSRRRDSAPSSDGSRCRRPPLAAVLPVSIDPVTSWMAGSPADAAPISCAGTVLSQPPISITASIGWARIISSVSIAIRLRRIHAGRVGEALVQRDGRELHRQAAGQHHAALDRLDQRGALPWQGL
jgi:hypothetical protein